MEEKVLTLADIGVTALHIGYNEDCSKAVIEINRVGKDRETLSKLETLKDNFKFRPTGQKSLYEIEEITVYEHFYRLHCIKVEERDKPVKEAMPKYVINIKTVFGQFSDTGSFDGLIYECKLNDKTNEALSLLYKNKDSVLLVVSGYAPVYRAVRADLDSEEKKIKVYLSIYAYYNNVRKDVTWLHSLEDLKAIGDESKVPWNAGMLTYKIEDAMPKKKSQLPVVVDLYKELDVVEFLQNENGDYVVEVKCNDKMKAFHRKYAGCKPIFELHTLEYKKYLTIKCEGGELIDTAFWTLEELNPTVAGVVFNERVTQDSSYERILKDYVAEPKLVGKLCSSMDSAPTTRRINSVKLNKVTRL